VRSVEGRAYFRIVRAALQILDYTLADQVDFTPLSPQLPGRGGFQGRFTQVACQSASRRQAEPDRVPTRLSAALRGQPGARGGTDRYCARGVGSGTDRIPSERNSCNRQQQHHGHADRK